MMGKTLKNAQIAWKQYESGIGKINYLKKQK